MLLAKIKFVLSNETLRNGAFFTLFSFINKGMNFILLLLLAKYISPTEYGYWSLFGTVVMFIGYFMAMSTEGYIPISYFQEGIKGVKKTVGCILFTTLIALCTLVSILTFFKENLEQSLKLPWQYLYLSIGIAFFTVFFNVCLNYFRIKKKITLYGLISCGSAFLTLVLSILFVKALFMGWQGCALAQFLSIALCGFAGLSYFIFSNKISLPNKTHWKTMLCWGIPLIPHLATQFTRLGCDRYIIEYYYSIDDVGLFSFAFTLATAISTIGYGFNEANSINVYEILGNKEISFKEKITLLNRQKINMFLVCLCGSIVIVLLGYFLIPIFLPKYTAATTFFFLLAIYAFLQCIYYLYTNFLFYFKKTKLLMAITVSFAFIHLFLSLALTRHSIYYTCLAYCFTQLGVVFFIRKSVAKELKEKITLKKRSF